VADAAGRKEAGVSEQERDMRIKAEPEEADVEGHMRLKSRGDAEPPGGAGEREEGGDDDVEAHMKPKS
jgi:hypothetical protein